MKKERPYTRPLTKEELDFFKSGRINKFALEEERRILRKIDKPLRGKDITVDTLKNILGEEHLRIFEDIVKRVFRNT